MIKFLIYFLLVSAAMGEVQPKPQPLLDWSFVAGHSIYGAASAFDHYETAKYAGVCAFESNSDLARVPSSRSLAINGLVEFGAVVGIDLITKAALRHNDVPRWMSLPVSNIGAMVGTVKHTEAGMQWVNLCH